MLLFLPGVPPPVFETGDVKQGGLDVNGFESLAGCLVRIV